MISELYYLEKYPEVFSDLCRVNRNINAGNMRRAIRTMDLMCEDMLILLYKKYISDTVPAIDVAIKDLQREKVISDSSVENYRLILETENSLKCSDETESNYMYFSMCTSSENVEILFDTLITESILFAEKYMMNF